MSERSEQGLVQQLVAQSTVEAFDEGILLRLCRARCSAIRSAVSWDQRRIAMLVSSVPLSDTHIGGRPRSAMMVSSSRTTRLPEQ